MTVSYKYFESCPRADRKDIPPPPPPWESGRTLEVSASLSGSAPLPRRHCSLTPLKMTTIPSRLARTTTTSGSWPVAQARSRALYRAWYRSGASLSDHSSPGSADTFLEPPPPPPPRSNPYGPHPRRATLPRARTPPPIAARSCRLPTPLPTRTPARTRFEPPAPEITQLYAVNFPASAIRAKVRQEYERNSLVEIGRASCRERVS